MIQQLPSIFDHIASGLSGGQQAYNQQQAVNTSNNDRQLQTMLGLIQSGELDPNSPQVQQNPLMAKLTGGAPLTPNVNFQRNQIASGATPSDTLAPAQRSVLGLPTAGATAIDSARAKVMASGTPDQQAALTGTPSSAQTSADAAAKVVNDIHTRAANGDPSLTDQQYEIAGLKTPNQMQADQIKAIDPTIEQKAQNYVDQIFNSHGGRLAPSQAATAGELAYQQYKAERAQTRMGQFDPSQEAYARSFFQSAVMNRLQDQRKMDIAQTQATIGKVPEEDRLYSLLDQSKATEKSLIQNAIGSNPALAAVITKGVRPDGTVDPSVVTPMFKTQVDQYISANRRIRQLDQAQNMALFGASKQTIAKFLGYDPTSQQSGVVNAPTGSPTPGATSSGTPPARPTSVPDMPPDVASRAVQMLQAMSSDDRAAMIQKGITDGTISNNDVIKLKNRFGIK